MVINNKRRLRSCARWKEIEDRQFVILDWTLTHTFFVVLEVTPGLAHARSHIPNPDSTLLRQVVEFEWDLNKKGIWEFLYSGNFSTSLKVLENNFDDLNFQIAKRRCFWQVILYQ
jgi:hypothetical protein